MHIVITGTRKGIGKFLAEKFLAEGHHVYGCSRGEGSVEHPNYFHSCVDVANELEVKKFSSEVRKKTACIDAVINNAGRASMNHFLLTPGETAKSIMDLNYMGAYHCSRAFVNLLKKSEHARIVNFSTVAVPLNLEGEIAYVASKSALEAFSRVLAKELAPFRITVNCVGPTPVKTDLIAKVPQNKLDDLLSMQAIKRFGEFSDVANVIDFYLKPESDFITGQVVYLGGVSK
jgi:3-oxoacyl-[acyl-carrier protein] reductase